MDSNGAAGLRGSALRSRGRSEAILLDGDLAIDGRNAAPARAPAPWNPIDAELRKRQREEKRRRTRNRKRDRQQMQGGNSATNAIELLDDDEESDDNVIDVSTKPAAVPRVPSPIQEGEVQVLDGPQRKAPVVGASASVVAGPSSYVLRVLEIFPDADVEYVKTKLREQKNNIEIVVAVLSEDDNYPKQKGSLNGTNNSYNNNKPYSNGTVIRVKSNQPKHDYSSPSTSFEISEAYRSQVIALLLHDFTFFKRTGLMSLLKQHKWRYTLIRNHIHDMIVGKSPNDTPPAAAAAGSTASAKLEKTEIENYQLLRSVLVRGSLPKELQQRMGSHYCLKKPRRKIGIPPPPITDPVLLDERLFYENKFQQWIKGIRDKLRGEAANKLALENGTAVSCSCCFDDVAISECVPCKEQGHLFCKACIVQYVKTQVFDLGTLGIDKETKKPALELKCCAGSNCNSGFRQELLEKVLPPNYWKKYSEMQTNIQIQQAGLGGNLAMCPKCGYQAEVAETQNIFDCPVEDCRFVSCRKCGKASHIPLRCEEVTQQNRRDAGRLKIEEALSEAKMRTCPKCKKKFIKSDGCNKMTCACGMKICYVCRKPLDKLKGNVYSHFCQVPHCDHSSCGKCKLYSNNEEDDAQAMREAGIAAKEAYEEKLQTEDGDGTENLQLNVDEIMANPFQPTSAKKKNRRGEVPVRPRPPAVHANRQGAEAQRGHAEARHRQGQREAQRGHVEARRRADQMVAEARHRQGQRRRNHRNNPNRPR